MPDPALLYVLMQPKSETPEALAAFHDWYNNEHGPLRVRLPTFHNGFRYKAADGEKPGFVAWYDMDSNALELPSYTALRENRSQREEALVENDLEVLDRRIYKLITKEGNPSHGAEVLLAVSVIIDKDKPEYAEDLVNWYEQEHIGKLSKVLGWAGSRLFELTDNTVDKPLKHIEYLALHEYAADNGLGGHEHELARNTEWRTRVMSQCKLQRRVFAKFYEFGPVPRDLKNAPEPKVIESVFTTKDNTDIPYRYEGSGDPGAPVIAFSNSFLTDYRIWDSIIATLRKKFPGYRFLRYNTRGYGDIKESKTSPITFDVLTNDLAELLDALKIERLHAVVGVSMGGCTSLNFAIRYPARLDRFVACDFNIASSEAGTKAWKERLAMVKAEGMSPLVDQTIKRWFRPETLQHEEPESIKQVREMISKADMMGSERSVNSLCDFNLKEGIKTVEKPGLFVVGDSDGVLPAAMGEFSKGLKNGKFFVVKDSGHLPMVENPEGFIEAVGAFLA